MAQAQGGTAGSSVGRGNGSMSGNNGNRSGGNGGRGTTSSERGGSAAPTAAAKAASARASNGGSGGSSAATNNSTSQRAQAAKAAGAMSSALSGENKSQSLMGGLISSVSEARSARTGTQAGIQNAVSQAFGSASSPGYSNATIGSVDNRIGAMNTPQAKEKAASQTAAFDTGYRNEANRGMTESAFGATGSLGALAGKAVGALSSMNGYASGTDESNAANRGAALASQVGLSSGTRGLGSLAAGVLGGPIGSALASMALGATSYGMQRSYHPSAFDGQAPVNGSPSSQSVTGQTVGTANGSSAMANALGSGGNSSDIYGGAIAAVPFDFASDYSDQYNSYRNLNLGSII